MQLPEQPLPHDFEHEEEHPEPQDVQPEPVLELLQEDEQLEHPLDSDVPVQEDEQLDEQ